MPEEIPEFGGSQQGQSAADGSQQGQAGAGTSQPAYVGTPVECELVVDGKKIRYDISGLKLVQPIDGHHVLTLHARSLGEIETGRDISDQVSPYAAFLGKSLSLVIKPSGGQVADSKELTFIGIITHVEVSNSVGALDAVTVTAHSPTISLDGAGKNAFYHEQSASDVIGAILRQYPMTLGDTDSTPGIMRFCVQYRETDYDFVCRLASGNGLFAYYDGEEFRVIKATSSEVEDLTWRETLGAFSLRWGTAQSEYASQVYNYEQTKTYAQDTTSLTSHAALSDISEISPNASTDIFQGVSFDGGPKAVADAQSLDRSLEAQKLRSLGRMIRCHGYSIVPSVAVGHCIKVAGMASFNGVYWVTQLTHHLDETGAYYNTFECTPLDMAYPQIRSRRAAVSNLQSAEVIANDDPEMLGRIKVKFPWNDGDETYWVRLVVPHAGQDRGWYSLPEIGDEVIIGYEQGSPDLPIALGAMYNSENAPLGEVVNDQNDIKAFITKGGNRIELTDTAGEEKISIMTKDGGCQVVLDAAAPSITVKSNGDISLEGANITLKADQNIALDGQQIEIKAGGDLKSEAGMNMATKAGIEYKIEGTMVTVKGNPIQLN